jgi:CxxC motif-containing protein
MNEETMVCICCPMSCELHIHKVNGEYHIENASCKKGRDYAIQEMTNPMRLLTTTIRINNGTHPMLPVRSNREIPKNLMMEAVKNLASVSINAPVKCGEVIINNFLGLGVDIIASRDMNIGPDNAFLD